MALLGVTRAHAAADDPPSARYVVARQAIAPGTALDSSTLELAAADLPPSTAERAFHDRTVLEGAITLAPLAAGELVQLSQVLPAAAGAVEGVELSFAVAPERALGGAVRPGERVDLVATFATGEADIVAEQALVTSVAAGGDALLGDPRPIVLTVRLRDRDELLGVVHAVDEGQVTVARPGTGLTA